MKHKLVINVNTEYLSTSFGMPEDVFHRLINTIIGNMARIFFVEPTISRKTAVIKAVLHCPDMEKLDWEPKTESDYFILGFIFSETSGRFQQMLDGLDDHEGLPPKGLLEAILGGMQTKRGKKDDEGIKN